MSASINSGEYSYSKKPRNPSIYGQVTSRAVVWECWRTDMGSQQGHRKGINLSRLKMDIATKARGRKKNKKDNKKGKNQTKTHLQISFTDWAVFRFLIYFGLCRIDFFGNQIIFQRNKLPKAASYNTVFPGHSRMNCLNSRSITEAFLIWQLEGHSAGISCLCHCFALEKNALFKRTANGFHNGYSRLWLIGGDTIRIECFLLHDDYAAYLFHCSVLHSYK